MRYSKIIIILILLLLLINCKTEPKKNSHENNIILVTNGETIEDSTIEYIETKTYPANSFDKTEFSEVKSLSQFKQTKFLTTLNSKLDKNKNGVYAATLLMAWDEIKEIINDSITFIESKELNLMNNSTSHQNILKKHEYETSVEINNNIIIAKAYFKKLLPFPYPLTDFGKTLKFGKTKVNSFGFNGENSFTSLEYYNNDNDFAIKLNSKIRNHEIILIKSKVKKSNINEEINKYLSECKEFRKTSNSKRNRKNKLKYEDKVRIPMIDFNLETHFKEIEKTKFNTNKQKYEVLTAWQRNAFILNEKGAKVESVAIIAVTESVEEINEIPKPKNLLFDKPFIVLLKRKDSKNPYFALYIANSELLKK